MPGSSYESAPAYTAAELRVLIRRLGGPVPAWLGPEPGDSGLAAVDAVSTRSLLASGAVLPDQTVRAAIRRRLAPVLHPALTVDVAISVPHPVRHVFVDGGDGIIWFREREPGVWVPTLGVTDIDAALAAVLEDQPLAGVLTIDRPPRRPVRVRWPGEFGPEDLPDAALRLVHQARGGTRLDC